MQIFIKSSVMKGFTLDVELTNTIGMIKKMVSEKHNISLEWIRFVNTGKLLDDSRTLEECGIDTNNDILTMIYGNFQKDRSNDEVTDTAIKTDTV